MMFGIGSRKTMYTHIHASVIVMIKAHVHVATL